jgi:hypothetical protein
LPRTESRIAARRRRTLVLTARRTLIVASCVAIVAVAACGGGPTGPSRTDGTTISGTVSMNGGAAMLPGAAATALTVSVVGTNLSATVEGSGYFQLPGVPSGTVRLQFKDAIVNATVELSNVGQEQLIEIQVQLTSTAAVIVNEVRTNTKVSLCHRTEAGFYNLISVSENAEPAHRAHGDGKIGEPVPGEPKQVFDESCRAVGPAVRIEKSTNGEDADDAPGPTIVVGSAVTWQYVVTNTGTIPLTNVVVADNRNVTVTCPGTTLAVGQSMTCTGSGAAIAGQYSNVGTVTANSASGTVSDTDPSHYFGQAPETDEGPKVKLCHRTGNGSYHLIEVSVNAEPAHRAHGDGMIGEAVPGSAGKVFGAGCSVN